MNTTTPATPSQAIPPRPALTDINGLRLGGIFPTGREPSVRTLREWTRTRRIPHHRIGHFVYYDLAEVSAHIRTKLLVPARG
ncbi:helix-turn-helix domain-containing protein [Termitidicoccus mucosus]